MRVFFAPSRDCASDAPRGLGSARLGALALPITNEIETFFESRLAERGVPCELVFVPLRHGSDVDHVGLLFGVVARGHDLSLSFVVDGFLEAPTASSRSEGRYVFQPFHGLVDIDETLSVEHSEALAASLLATMRDRINPRIDKRSSWTARWGKETSLASGCYLESFRIALEQVLAFHAVGDRASFFIDTGYDAVAPLLTVVCKPDHRV